MTAVYSDLDCLNDACLKPRVAKDNTIKLKGLGAMAKAVLTTLQTSKPPKICKLMYTVRPNQ